MLYCSTGDTTQETSQPYDTDPWWMEDSTEAEFQKCITGDTTTHESGVIVKTAWHINAPTSAFANWGTRTGQKVAQCINCDTGRVPLPDGNWHSCCQYDTGQHLWSPIIVDVDNLGAPDLLAGPDAWSRLQAPDLNLTHYRSFMIDGTNPQLVQWVGPKAGILVYGRGGKCPEGQLTGKDLFGNVFQGGTYANGYLALATLDNNHNGALEGKELDEVFVWRDANGNGCLDPGEAVPAKTLFASIGTRCKTTPNKDAFNLQGAKRLDGTVVSSWDWWTQVYPDVTIGMGSVQPGRVYPTYRTKEEAARGPEPIIFWWKGLAVDGPQPYGLLRFFWDRQEKQWLVLSVGPDYKGTAMVSELFPSHSQLEWVFSTGPLALATRAVFTPHGLKGTSVFSDGSQSQTWEAFEGALPVPVPYELASLITVSDEDLARAARGKKAILVPYGCLDIPQGARRTLKSSLELFCGK